jgi:lipoprotein-anchoring transpeptidase ErfK/SrfK
MPTKLSDTEKSLLNKHLWFESLGQASGIWVSADKQQLTLIRGDTVTGQWPISTGQAGLGQEEDSGLTPKGWHEIAEKIGEGKEPEQIFVSRQATAERWQAGQESEKDVILARILWLRGLEEGLNTGTRIDSFQRHIYIHGTNQPEELGKPASMGCVRMQTAAVIELFERVEIGTKVLITAE